MADEVVKVKIDISDVIVKRTAEINEAKRAEKEKIAALKREQSESEKQQKYIADLKSKYFAQDQRDRDKAAKDAERAAERAAKGPSEWTLALKANTEAMAAQKGQINQSGEALGKLASAVGAVDPKLGTMVAGLQKATGVLSAGATAAQGLGATLGTVGAALGPLALAVGAVALAWNSYEEDVKEAEEATKKLREEQEKLNEAMAPVRTLAQKSAAEIERLAVANGKLSQEQYELNELGREWSAQLAAARAPLEKLRQANLDAKDTSRAHADELVDLEQKLRDANEAAAAGYSAAKVNLEIKQETADSEEELARRLKAREAAERNATKATKEATTELKDKQQSLEDIIAEEERWAAIERTATEEAHANARARVEQDQEILANRKAGHDEMVEMWEEERSKQLEVANDVANTASNVADSIGSLFQDALDTRTDYIDDLNDEYEEALEEGNDAKAASLKKQMKAEKEAALKTFYINKALTIASATLSTVAATAKALEAGWPALLITVPAALAAGGAQIALAAKQKPPEFDDTNQIRQAVAAQGDNRVNVSAKNGDLVAMAQTPAGLKKQVDQMGGEGKWESAASMLNDVLPGRAFGAFDTVTRGLYRRAA